MLQETPPPPPHPPDSHTETNVKEDEQEEKPHQSPDLNGYILNSSLSIEVAD
jgi:hypothetical protein